MIKEGGFSPKLGFYPGHGGSTNIDAPRNTRPLFRTPVLTNCRLIGENLLNTEDSLIWNVYTDNNPI